MDHVRILALMVTHLAAGGSAVLPFEMGARRTEWSETFSVGHDRVNGGDAVLHQSSWRKDGTTSSSLADPCDWGLGGMLDQIRSWDEATRTFLTEPFPAEPSAHPDVRAILSIATADVGAVVTVAGHDWRVTETEDGRGIEKADTREAKWTFDETVMAVRA